MTPISQAEARRLRKRVRELERQETLRNRRWAQDYPGGTHLRTINGLSDATIATVETARALKHAVVAVPHEGKLYLYGLPQGGNP